MEFPAPDARDPRGPRRRLARTGTCIVARTRIDIGIRVVGPRIATDTCTVVSPRIVAGFRGDIESSRVARSLRQPLPAQAPLAACARTPCGRPAGPADR